MQQNHAIAVIMIVLFLVITALSFGIYKLIQAGRAQNGTTTTTEESLADDDEFVPPVVPPHAPRWRPPIVPPDVVPQMVVPPPPPSAAAAAQQQPVTRRPRPASRVSSPPQPPIVRNVQPVHHVPQLSQPRPQPVVQRAQPIARARPQASEKVQTSSRPVVRQASASHVQQTRLPGVQRRARSRPVVQSAPQAAVMADSSPVEMVQRPTRPAVQATSASVIQEPREQISSARSGSSPSAQQSTASASEATDVRRRESRSRSRSRPAALTATASAPAPAVRKVKKRSAQTKRMSMVAEQDPIVVHSPVVDRSVNSQQLDPIAVAPGPEPGPEELYPIPVAPEPEPGSLPPAGVAMPGDIPPDMHEADIYHAHPARPSGPPSVGRRYFPPPYQQPIVFEMNGGPVRRGAASITGTLPRHANQRLRRTRAALLDYFIGARFMGMRRVVGTDLNIFHAPIAPANAGTPKGPKSQPQQLPGAYMAPDDDD